MFVDKCASLASSTCVLYIKRKLLTESSLHAALRLPIEKPTSGSGKHVWEPEGGVTPPAEKQSAFEGAAVMAV